MSHHQESKRTQDNVGRKDNTMKGLRGRGSLAGWHHRELKYRRTRPRARYDTEFEGSGRLMAGWAKKVVNASATRWGKRKAEEANRSRSQLG